MSRILYLMEKTGSLFALAFISLESELLHVISLQNQSVITLSSIEVKSVRLKAYTSIH